MVWAGKPEVIIDPGGVNAQALQVITQSVDVIATQAEDQDGGEADRLRRRARDATLAALATQGYFSAQVALQAGTDVAGETWDIVIKPGRRAVISSVDLRFEGRITRPEYAERVAQLRKTWLLPAGQPFINADWNKAKADLLDDVGMHDFLLARMTASGADVDAEAAQVGLRVTIDSGPQVLLGELHTRGLERVPEALIGRYIRYRAGAAYSQTQLDEWQQDLQGTSFFRGAFVTVKRPGEEGFSASPGLEDDDERIRRPRLRNASLRQDDGLTVGRTDPTQPEGDARVAGGIRPQAPPVDSDSEITLPVQVRVVEAPPKRFSSSLGIDSDVGVRGEAQYRQNVVLGQPLTMETGVGLDRKRQRAYADFILPPTEKGYRDSIGLLADRSNIQGLRQTRYAVGANHRIESRGPGRVDYETRFGLLGAYDKIAISGAENYNLPTLTGTTQWLRRDVDSRYNPREGNLIALGGGVGMTLDKQEAFTRADLRVQKWWPMFKRDVLTVRGELGKVWANERVRIPDDFGYRTGGARTIRGYKYLGLGERRGDAVVGAAAMAVASIEYDHYFDDTFGMGVFMDAGDAASSFGSMQWALGYGVGARVRTPAGPLFLDVAHATRGSGVRLQFSLGIAF
jgi:translocation and assembly module TamA